MKNNNGYAVIILTLLLAVGLGVWWYTATQKAPEPTPVVTTPVVVPLHADWKTYSSTEYGFQIKYSEDYVAKAALPDDPQKKIVRFDYTDPRKGGTAMDSITVRAVPWGMGQAANWQNIIMNDVVFDGSGAHPQAFTEFTERKIGNKTFYSIKTGRFEGILAFTYYSVSEKYGILAFDARAEGVDWTNPNLDEENDSVHKTLRTMLETFNYND